MEELAYEPGSGVGVPGSGVRVTGPGVGVPGSGGGAPVSDVGTMTMLLVGGILIGAGNSASVVHGLSYLDDISTPRRTGVNLG